MNLLRHIKINTGSTQGFGASDCVGNVLDMQGYEGVLFILHGTSRMGVAPTSSKMVIKHSSISTTAAMVEFSTAHRVLLPTEATTAFPYQAKINAIDVYKPTKRYIMCSVLKSTGAVGGATLTAIQYGAKQAGTTQWIDATTAMGNVKVVVGGTSQ